MQGPITPIQRSKTVDLREKRLPTVWLKEQRSPKANLTRNKWIHRTDTLMPFEGDTLLVFCGENQTLLEEAVSQAQSKEARVYALVGGQNEIARTLRTKSTLVRRILDVPFSGFVSESGASVALSKDRVLHLENGQKQALRHLFLRLFWHEAFEEAFLTTSGWISRKAQDRPFDVPEISSKSELSLQPVDYQPKSLKSKGVLYRSNGPVPQQHIGLLFYPADGQRQAELGALKKNGADVKWEHLDLPDFLCTTESGEIVIRGKQKSISIRLNEGQAEEAQRILPEAPEWAFELNVRLGDYDGKSTKFLLPGQQEAKPLEPVQDLNAPNVNATTLRKMEDIEPEHFPPADDLALTAKYTWKVIPPYVPKGASPDALVESWKKIDSEWTGRVEKVRSSLKRAEEEQGRLANAFSRLFNAMTGFKRKQQELTSKITSLAEVTPSMVSTSEAESKFEELSRLESEADSLLGQLEESEQKAQEDEEREQQKKAWEKRVKDAEDRLPDAKSELDAAKEEQLQLQQVMKELEEKSKGLDKKGRKELRPKLLKAQDRLKQENNAVKRLEGEVQSLEKTTRELFEFRPSKKYEQKKKPKGRRFVLELTSSKKNPQIPSEALPYVGTLYQSKKKRYLVIQRWEDLAEGETEAERLKAELVTKES